MNTLTYLSATIILFFCFAGNAMAQDGPVDRQIIVMFQPTAVSLPGQTVKTDRIDQVTMPDDVRNVLKEASVQEIEKGFPDFRSEDTLRVLSDGRIYRVPDWTNLFIITLPENVSRDSLIINLDQLPYVVYAEKNQMGVLRGEVLPSNQQHFDDQWGSKNLQDPGQDIQATYAWSLTTGSSGNILGVVDTGVQSTHTDLSGKVSGPAAFTGSYSGDHGTMVAGVAAAHGDNSGGGIAGVDWHVEIHAEQLGSLTQTAQVIDGAVNAGAIVINNSWGYENTSATLSAALRSAYGAGVLLVHANPYESGSPDQTSDYPNNLGPWILNVGAIEETGDAMDNTGSRSFTDVAAPGVDITSTSSQSGTPYRTGTGTSYAAPHVAGTATLMLSVNPDIKNDDINQILMRTASRYPNPGHDPEVGYGLINAVKALERLKAPYVLNHYTANNGSVHSSTGTYYHSFFDVPGLAGGTYQVKRYDVRQTVNIDEELNETYVWGRGVGTVGYSAENPNFAMGYTNIVSSGSSSATLQTYVYEVRNNLGQLIGWFPATPANVEFAYTVHGLPTSIGGGSEEVSFNHNFVLDDGMSLTILSGTEVYIGDGSTLTVTDDATLTIEPGVHVFLGKDAGIDVEDGGSISAVGTKSSPIVFTTLHDTSGWDGSDEWAEVYLASGGNEFQWTIFEYGNKHVNIASRDNTIENSIFRHGWRGISSTSNQAGSGMSEVYMENVLIEENRDIGFVASNNESILHRVSILDNDNNQGIWYTNSDGVGLSYSLIEMRTGPAYYTAVDVSNNSTVWIMQHDGQSLGPGYNTLDTDMGPTVRKFSSATWIQMGNSSSMPGFNNVIGNPNQSWIVDNQSSSEIKAHENWWGGPSTPILVV